MYDTLEDMDSLRIVSGTDDILQTGQHLAFFGRSNVGKSSTINALLNNKNAARISGTPGKTVTFNLFDISADEESKRYLVDLPGYGYAKHGEKFREKLRRRLLFYLGESSQNIEYFCLVLDAKAGLTEIDQSAIDMATQSELKIILLVNKADKLNQKQLSQLQKDLSPYLSEHDNIAKVFYYSAKTKKGIEKVQNFLDLI